MPPAFSTLGWYSKLEEPHLTSVNVFGSIEGHTPSLTFKNPFENHFMLIKSIDRIHYPFLFCRAETSVLTRLMHSFSESPRWISANFLLNQTCQFSCLAVFFPGRIESRAKAKSTGLFFPFHDRKWKGRLKKLSKKADGYATPKPRLMGVGEKELTQKGEEALALRVLHSGYN